MIWQSKIIKPKSGIQAGSAGSFRSIFGMPQWLWWSGPQGLNPTWRCPKPMAKIWGIRQRAPFFGDILFGFMQMLICVLSISTFNHFQLIFHILVGQIHTSFLGTLVYFHSVPVKRWEFYPKTAPSPQLDSPDNIMSAVDTEIFGPYLARSTLDGCMYIFIYI